MVQPVAHITNHVDLVDVRTPATLSSFRFLTDLQAKRRRKMTSEWPQARGAKGDKCISSSWSCAAMVFNVHQTITASLSSGQCILWEFGEFLHRICRQSRSFSSTSSGEKVILCSPCLTDSLDSAIVLSCWWRFAVAVTVLLMIIRTFWVLRMIMVCECARDSILSNG